MENIEILRSLPVSFLTTHMSHFPFEDAIKDFPLDSINRSIENQPFSFWELLEHIRRMFQEILDYVVQPDYEFIETTDKYWPLKTGKAVTTSQWNHTITEIRRLYKEFVNLINDPSIEILSELKYQQGTGHTYLRQILMVIDHNSYHLAQFILLRKIMEIWR